MKNLLSSRPSLFSSVATLLILLCSGIASAEPDNDKQFRFNVSPNGYPPYLIVDQASPSGIMWDVVSLIVDRMGYTVVPLKIPRKRVDSMLSEGFIDGTPRAREWTKDPEKFLFTDAVVNVEEVIFSREALNLTYESPKDLITRTVVTHLGYIYPMLDPYFETGDIQRFDVPRDQDMFTFVLHDNHYNIAVADRLVGQWFLKNHGHRNEFNISEANISEFGYRVMVRKGNQDFVDRFNQELRQIRENGELNAILAKYK